MDFSGMTLVKVGGSLLNLPDLASRLSTSLATISRPLLLVGGGIATNVIREWDEIHRLGEETAHQLAMESMRLSARLVTALLNEAELCLVPQLAASLQDQNRIPVIHTCRWLEEFEPSAKLPLAHTWEATSDTIALWLCAELEIPRLTMLKSVDRPSERTWEQLEGDGVVDGEFHRLHRQLEHPPEISWCNLRKVSSANDE